MSEDILKQLESKKYKAVFESVKSFPAQFESALNQKIFFPDGYRGVKNIVLCGMGGSALPAHILQAFNVSLAPFYFYNGYEPPAYVGRDTLFIASSYSGNTEEVLASYKLAKNRGAKIAGMAAGGTLADALSKDGFPIVKFDEKFNPSGQPRYGLGYGLGGLFNILMNLGLISMKASEVRGTIAKLKLPALEKAAALAKELDGFAPLVVASGFLEGNAHVFVNQLNETCKNFSEFHSIPALNHHLMEGLKRPRLGKYLKFLFLESDLYSKEIVARFKITKDIVQKNKVSYTEYRTHGKTRFEQSLNFLMFAGLVSLALAVMNAENPTDIPFVNYFKSELRKML